MKVTKIVVQTLILIAISVLGDEICSVFHWSIPGSMVGLFLLFALLELKIVKLEWFELGGNWLISTMLLFFVPSAVGVIQYQALVRHEGLQLVLVIAASTLFVMGSTGLLAERLTLRKNGKKVTSDHVS